MLILIDQDGVLADFDLAFHAAWKALDHPHPPLAPSERRAFYVRDDYPEHLRATVEEIYTSQGFFRSLPPIPGAVDAVRELMSLGHEVCICTSPLNQYRHCVPEKYEWVEHHLGPEFVGRMIMAKDKTLVYGDVLVDDKPEVTGFRKPSWSHVIYDQPYNRSVDGVRITWANWRDTLLRV